MSSVAKRYSERGLTPIMPVVGAEVLEPLQHLIYQHTKDLLEEHDAELSIAEKLRTPFRQVPEGDDFLKVMEAVNSSEELRNLIKHSEVKASFEKVLDSSQVKRFPISRFRAQFPSVEKSTYTWHQDEGTWYAVPVKELAYKLPTTLWLSINGADETNSIELIPDTHTGRLENHYEVEGQGYFNADLPESAKDLPRVVVKTNPGEGIFFHPLTFHRSIKGQFQIPRYSVDIRYYAKRNPSENVYDVDARFEIKRDEVETMRLK